MNDGIVVCFSGRIGSGKSSVTKALATALNWCRAAFGDYVRARVAEQGGDPTSREELQNLGQALVDADPEAFAAAVIKSAGYEIGANLLVDGVRHWSIQAKIVGLVAPSPAFLLHLAADDAHVHRRVSSSAFGDLDRAQAHVVEAELNLSLPDNANVIIDANASLANVPKCVP